jgi:hypothetical protein
MSIITTPASENQIEVLLPNIDPQTAQAIQAITTGKVQPNVIRQYNGKGGKLFSYIPHTDGTKTMQDAFGQRWDWEVVRHDVFADGSAIAYGRISIHFFDQAGQQVHTRVIQEVGGREPIVNKDGKVTSVTAFTVLGAASRSLLRCMMRAFGYGLELYREEDEDFTVEQAYLVLQDYARTQGLKDERHRWVDALKAIGITKENMLDRFEEAYKAIYEVGKQVKQEGLARRSRATSKPS